MDAEDDDEDDKDKDNDNDEEEEDDDEDGAESERLEGRTGKEAGTFQIRMVWSAEPEARRFFEGCMAKHSTDAV